MKSTGVLNIPVCLCGESEGWVFIKEFSENPDVSFRRYQCLTCFRPGVLASTDSQMIFFAQPKALVHDMPEEAEICINTSILRYLKKVEKSTELLREEYERKRRYEIRRKMGLLYNERISKKQAERLMRLENSIYVEDGYVKPRQTVVVLNIFPPVSICMYVFAVRLEDGYIMDWLPLPR